MRAACEQGSPQGKGAVEFGRSLFRYLIAALLQSNYNGCRFALISGAGFIDFLAGVGESQGLKPESIEKPEMRLEPFLTQNASIESQCNFDVT
jgi:hypothetical protein